MKKLSIILLFVFICLHGIKGQGDFGRATPQVADFIRHGEVPVSLYTGSLSYEVPIYRIETRDISIPVSLCYTSDGFKPNKRPSAVGYNWFLNAGGCITREIYMAPDDSERTRKSGVISFDIAGYNVCRKNEAIAHNKSDLYSLSEDLFSKYWQNMLYIEYDGYWEDTMPDLFSFNMCGHSGTFVIGNDGNPVSFPKGYRIDVSSMSNQPLIDSTSSPSLPKPSQITITAPDGTVFTFGNINDLSAVEFSRNFSNQNLSNGKPYHSPPVINAWHLTGVSTVHGDRIFFYYYNPDIEGDLHYYAENDSASIWQTTLTSKPSHSMSGPPLTIESYSETKSVFLESIVVSDGTVLNFHKSREPGNFYPSAHGYLTGGLAGLKYDRPMFQLDSVSIKHYGEEVYQCTLAYETKSRSSSRTEQNLRFLKSVCLNHIHNYTFDYKHPSNNIYPDPVSIGVSTDREGYMKLYNDNGVLEKITYPTGGYTWLEYERHDYAKRVDHYSPDNKCVDDPFLNEDPTIEEQLGGLRIKKIRNYSNGSLASSKEYYYVADTVFPIGSGGMKKSGIYLHYPPYITDVYGREILIDGNADIFSSNFNVSEPHVAYSHVLEYDGASNGYKRYSFTDYEDFPHDSENRNIESTGNNNRPDPSSIVGSSKITSGSQKRGLLKEIRYFDDEGRADGYEKYGYYYGNNDFEPNDPNAPDPFPSDVVIAVCPIVGGGIAMKVDQGRPALKEEVRMEGKRENSPVRQISYTHNDYDLVHKKTIIDSNGTKQITATTYACDTTGGVYDVMNSKNLISYPIEITVNQGGGETMRKKIEYHQNGMDIAAEYLSYGDGPMEQSISYDRYDEKGRLLQSTTSDGMVRSYVWRDAYCHSPIAEFVNADYDAVMGAMSTINDNYDKIDLLRENLPEAQVTTYTYKPLVGITSSTDARGVKVHYNYDYFGRLTSITDDDGNLIEQYDYHYKQ